MLMVALTLSAADAFRVTAPIRGAAAAAALTPLPAFAEHALVPGTTYGDVHVADTVIVGAATLAVTVGIFAVALGRQWEEPSMAALAKARTP